MITTEHNLRSKYRPIARLLNQLTVGRDTLIIAVSNEVLSEIRGRSRRRAAFLKHGVALDDIRRNLDARADVRRELGVTDHDVVVGSVGLFREQKDYPNLIGAAVALKAQGVRFVWVIVGDGPLFEDIQRFAVERGVDDVVRFLGRRYDAVRLMAGFDLFVMSSYFEGLPVAIMEAIAMHRPIVATAVGGINEELEGETCARLVPARDCEALAVAVRAVVEDRELRQHMSAGCAKVAERFDLVRVCEMLDATYQDAVTGEPGVVERFQARCAEVNAAG